MRRISVALIAGLATMVVAVGTPPSQASVTGHHRLLLPLAGSSQYLLYAEGEAGEPLRNIFSSGTLYAMSRAGERTRLTQYTRNHSYQASVLGSFAVVSDYAGRPPLTVRWWDLATGEHGEHAVDPETTSAQVAPDGWLYTTGGEPQSEELWYQKTDGTVRLLGSASTIRNSRIGYRSSLKRVVIYGNDEGHGSPGVGWIDYADPDTLHERLPNVYADCSDPSGGYVWCFTERFTADGGADYAMNLIPLDGSRILRDRRHCDYGDAGIVVGHRAVWITNGARKGCVAGRLISLSPSGNRVVSKSRLNSSPIFNNYGLVAGFGKILAVSASHRTIYALKSVRAKPKVLLHSS
jgi:hypothetical protein